MLQYVYIMIATCNSFLYKLTNCEQTIDSKQFLETKRFTDQCLEHAHDILFRGYHAPDISFTSVVGIGHIF